VLLGRRLIAEATGADVERLLAEGKTVIIDFHASWCAPCHAYSPKFSRIEREMRRTYPDGAFAFVSVDIDRNQEIAREANVRSVPTTVAWRNARGFFGGTKKKQVLRFSGDRSWEELVRTFRELLAS